jgi:hypothetical protein
MVLLHVIIGEVEGKAHKPARVHRHTSGSTFALFLSLRHRNMTLSN